VENNALLSQTFTIKGRVDHRPCNASQISAAASKQRKMSLLLCQGFVHISLTSRGHRSADVGLALLSYDVYTQTDELVE
jgi:hypothetical protein